MKDFWYGLVSLSKYIVVGVLVIIVMMILTLGFIVGLAV